MNIAYFKIVENIGNFLDKKIVDIRKNRSNKRWIFPEFPKSDSNYPEIVIEITSSNYENFGGGDNYSHNETYANGDYIEYYNKILKCVIHIYVLTSKEEEYEVFQGQDKIYLTNKPLNLYLANKVKDVMNQNRTEFVCGDNKFNEIQLTDIGFPYENNKHSWASDLTIEIELQDYWVKEYAKGELIASYNLSETVERT